MRIPFVFILGNGKTGAYILALGYVTRARQLENCALKIGSWPYIRKRISLGEVRCFLYRRHFDAKSLIYFSNHRVRILGVFEFFLRLCSNVDCLAIALLSARFLEQLLVGLLESGQLSVVDLQDIVVVALLHRRAYFTLLHREYPSDRIVRVAFIVLVHPADIPAVAFALSILTVFFGELGKILGRDTLGSTGLSNDVICLFLDGVVGGAAGAASWGISSFSGLGSRGCGGLLWDVEHDLAYVNLLHAPFGVEILFQLVVGYLDSFACFVLIDKNIFCPPLLVVDAKVLLVSIEIGLGVRIGKLDLVLELVCSDF